MHIETMFVVISLENASDSFHTVRFPCVWKIYALFQTLFLSFRVKNIEYHARIRVVYLDYLTPRTLDQVDHHAEKEPDATDED